MQRIFAGSMMVALVLAANPGIACEPPAAFSAQDTTVPVITDVRSALMGRDSVSLRLSDGDIVAGTIIHRTEDGLYLSRLPKAPRFVAFRAIAAILSPDSGAVEAYVQLPVECHSLRSGLLTAAGIFGFLAILTHGAIPVCLFANCR
jgi:hypothetical protein